MFDRDYRIDLRRARAMALTAEVMRTLDPFIRDGRLGEQDRDCRRDAHNAIFDLFYNGGWEGITDQMRAEAGLPPRDDKGWTRQEAEILERRRIDALINAAPYVQPTLLQR